MISDRVQFVLDKHGKAKAIRYAEEGMRYYRMNARRNRTVYRRQWIEGYLEMKRALAVLRSG